MTLKLGGWSLMLLASKCKRLKFGHQKGRVWPFHCLPSDINYSEARQQNNTRTCCIYEAAEYFTARCKKYVKKWKARSVLLPLLFAMQTDSKAKDTWGILIFSPFARWVRRYIALCKSQSEYSLPCFLATGQQWGNEKKKIVVYSTYVSYFQLQHHAA